jgi:LysR family transcriptional regulator, regulator for bpeEF and oprC
LPDPADRHPDQAIGKTFPLVFTRGGKEIEAQVQTMVTVNESTAHVIGLLAGLGVGQTFRYIAQPHFKTGALIRLLKDWGRPGRPIHLMYPANRHLKAKVRAFVDWAVEVFANLTTGWLIRRPEIQGGP